MDIKKRINARKIVLSYFYQHCFFYALDKKGEIKPNLSPTKEPEAREDQTISTPLSSEIKKSDFLDEDFLKEVAERKEAEEKWDEIVLAKINQYANEYAIEEEFKYILSYFFDQRTAEEVDVEYVLKVGNSLPRYEKELIQKVDAHAESFGYEKMDIINQVLLLLGYCEYKTLETPKEVILNEMVELSKRYADEGSTKLINGLLHTIFHAEESK